VIYVIARWRTYREGLPGDPHLGLKTAIGFFSFLSLQTFLVGAVLFFFGIIQKGDGGESIRTGLAMFLASGLVFGAHFVAAQRTNTRELPLIERMFVGSSLIVTGLFGFLALVALFVVLFQKGEGGNVLRGLLAANLIYLPAWGFQGLRFLQRTGFGGPPPGAGQFARPGSVPVPPPAVPLPPPAVPPPGGGGYPHT
jgi:hypothetical protein